jgi:hypothetical protein
MICWPVSLGINTNPVKETEDIYQKYGEYLNYHNIQRAILDHRKQAKERDTVMP